VPASGEQAGRVTRRRGAGRRLPAYACALALGAAGPALAGPPFLTDDPEPTEAGHWEIYAPALDAAGKGADFDGSLGVARGSQAYYFNETLRLQGVVAAGSPTGGVAMHPANAGYPGGSFRLSFVSGIDATGPYVDVIDNFNFFRVKRVYTRDPVVGAMAVAPRATGDAGSVSLRIYALTSRGILALPITTTDLTP